MKEGLHLKGGVLIIGSLLWQDDFKVSGDKIRANWRSNHLLLKNKIMVAAPIRYGRFSKTSNIFTMTFSKSVSKTKLGTGYFVPFKNDDISHFEELFNEASALSIAEGMKGNLVTDWSVIGIMLNTNKNDTIAKNKILKIWEQQLKQTNLFNNKAYKILKSEGPCIDKTGKLDFDWIKPIDSRQVDLLDSYDFLIATVTLPTKYPSVKELSECVKNDKNRYYFIENFKNGITTFQDISVINSQ